MELKFSFSFIIAFFAIMISLNLIPTNQLSPMKYFSKKLSNRKMKKNSGSNPKNQEKYEMKNHVSEGNQEEEQEIKDEQKKNGWNPLQKIKNKFKPKTKEKKVLSSDSFWDDEDRKNTEEDLELGIPNTARENQTDMNFDFSGPMPSFPNDLKTYGENNDEENDEVRKMNKDTEVGKDNGDKTSEIGKDNGDKTSEIGKDNGDKTSEIDNDKSNNIEDKEENQNSNSESSEKIESEGTERNKTGGTTEKESAIKIINNFNYEQSHEDKESKDEAKSQESEENFQNAQHPSLTGPEIMSDAIEHKENSNEMENLTNELGSINEKISQISKRMDDLTSQKEVEGDYKHEKKNGLEPESKVREEHTMEDNERIHSTHGFDQNTIKENSNREIYSKTESESPNTPISSKSASMTNEITHTIPINIIPKIMPVNEYKSDSNVQPEPSTLPIGPPIINNVSTKTHGNIQPNEILEILKKISDTYRRLRLYEETKSRKSHID